MSFTVLVARHQQLSKITPNAPKYNLQLLGSVCIKYMADLHSLAMWNISKEGGFHGNISADSPNQQILDALK